jgi:hypothetical protein
MRQEAISRVFREPGVDGPYVASNLLKKRLCEHQDGVWALTERRQGHLEHAEPVVQVFAKAPGPAVGQLYVRPASLRPCSSTPNERGVLGMRKR